MEPEYHDSVRTLKICGSVEVSNVYVSINFSGMVKFPLRMDGR